MSDAAAQPGSEPTQVAGDTGAPGSGRSEPGVCPSCGRASAGRYCPECGSRINAERLTLPSIFREAWRQMVEFDGPTVRTVVRLAYQPHRVAEAYIAGDRRKYLNPAKFCFVAGAVAVLTLSLFGINYFEVMRASGAVEIKANSADAEQTLREQFERGSLAFQDYLHLFTILSLPVPALAMRLLFRRAGRTIAEHLTLLLYAYGFAFLAQAATVPFGGYASGRAILVHTVAAFVYTTWAIVKFERAPWHTGLLRALLVNGVLIFASQLLLVGAVVVYIVLTLGES